MKLCMVGAGYVGLVSGAGFAEMGNQVICADVDRAKVATLRAGRMPIVEPELDELVARSVAARRLSFTDDLASAIAASDVIFIAVGTPGHPDGSVDTSAVESVAHAVAHHVTKETVLVLKSTVPPGTNRKVSAIVAQAAHPVHVVSNPEFLKEGDAIRDFMWPDRIIIGCAPGDEVARVVMRRVYQPLCHERDRIIWMDPVSAELTKYAGNALLAMRISFMNEVALLCERLGADVHQVRWGIGSDHRIGAKFLYAGAGYGGSCFPKDVRALIHAGRENGVELELVGATDRVNRRQKKVLLEKVRSSVGGELRGKTIGIWGMAFKPRTDDVREAPSMALIEGVLSEGARVIVHDPAGCGDALRRFGGRAKLAGDAYEAAEGADVLVLVTEWREYHNPDFKRLKSIMRNPALVDGRNIWAGFGLREQGFIYTGVGVRG